MDFPPVSNLVNVTFEQLATKSNYQKEVTPVQAPQPVANSQGIDGESESIGLASGAKSGTGRVGTVLDVSA